MFIDVAENGSVPHNIPWKSIGRQLRRGLRGRSAAAACWLGAGDPGMERQPPWDLWKVDGFWMETHHFKAGETHYVYGFFPVCYVTLPEGKPPCSYCFPLVSRGSMMIFPLKSAGTNHRLDRSDDDSARGGVNSPRSSCGTMWKQ